MTDPDLLSVQRDVDSPPGGWKYTVPQTGVLITGQFFSVLKKRVVAHLKANGHVVDDEVLALIEHGACIETRPPGWCKKRPPKPVAGMPFLTLLSAERFVRTVWQALKDRQFVPREEAERRLAICATCPLATSITGCSGCATLLKKVVELVDERSTLKDTPGKEFCGACGCYCRGKSLLSNSTLDKAEGSKRPPYWERCWRLGH